MVSFINSLDCNGTGTAQAKALSDAAKAGDASRVQDLLLGGADPDHYKSDNVALRDAPAVGNKCKTNKK